MSESIFTLRARISTLLYNFHIAGTVYVHCYQGMSRSATVLLAFLMIYRQMSLLDAIKQVRQRRAIHPNPGFMKQLVELNNQLAEETQRGASATGVKAEQAHDVAAASAQQCSSTDS